MTPTPYLENSPKLTTDRGRWCLPVDWDTVPVVFDHLRLRGCHGTLCLDPVSRSAHLVLWPGMDPWKAANLVGRLTGHTPTPFAQAA